ncbi:hypothetical protein QZK49_02120 [Acinetobacter baumannii]|nr:hypothetical protein [Acinetobacter baumannii]
MNIKNRKWKDFPKNFWENFTGLSIILTVIGFILGVGGWKLDEGWVQYFGVLSIISGIFLTIRLSWPEPVLQLKELVGKKLTLEEVNSIYPIPFFIRCCWNHKIWKNNFFKSSFKSLHSDE